MASDRRNVFYQNKKLETTEIGGAWSTTPTEGLLLMPQMNETERYVNDTFIVTCHGPRANNTTWKGPTSQPITATKGRLYISKFLTISNAACSTVVEKGFSVRTCVDVIRASAYPPIWLQIQPLNIGGLAVSLDR
ncbi:hypothetical protein AAG570_006363 [Ranatra chinensis]|uniref:Uncharacterized protein n=1 Tax=Ranatra chinensis TaxID=642074 RepID=A0ABD0ZGZ3_9HEMI